MKRWFEVEQYVVYSEDMGFGIVTAIREDGLLGVQFDADPWKIYHVDPWRVEKMDRR